ncbi:hypothetical protein HZH68_000423 [Vespula germanica]|uniref:Uncharacterized protein n=1 Tax=Vespula germanica TaxID=30212 RepID=A0A834NTQ9_VESGE|nr:hypothetical protein HZH68_000423 [Vespula germanica]
MSLVLGLDFNSWVLQMQQPPRGGTWVGITCDISNLMRCKVLRVKKVGRVRKILLLAKGTAKTTDLFGALGKDHPFRIPTPWTLAGTPATVAVAVAITVATAAAAAAAAPAADGNGE